MDEDPGLLTLPAVWLCAGEDAPWMPLALPLLTSHLGILTARELMPSQL